VVFFYLLDTVRVNANTVHALADNQVPTKSNAFQFGMKLAESLVMPYIQGRSRIGLQRSILTKIKTLTGEGEEGDQLQDGPIKGQRKRCSTCIEEIAGKDQKKKKDKLPKMTNCCQKCGNGLCKKHIATQFVKNVLLYKRYLNILYLYYNFVFKKNIRKIMSHMFIVHSENP